MEEIEIKLKEKLLNEGYTKLVDEQIDKRPGRYPFLKFVSLFVNEETKDAKILYSRVVRGFVRREELYELSLTEIKEMVDVDHIILKTIEKLKLLNYLKESLSTNEANINKPKL